MRFSPEEEKLKPLKPLSKKELEEMKRRVQGGKEPFENWETGTGLPKDWFLKDRKK